MISTSSILRMTFSFLATFAATVFLGSCATDQAAKVRNDKPATVGIWGGAYRPNGNVGVVTDLAGAVTHETDYKHVDENGDIKQKRGDKPVSQNIRTRNSQKIDLAVHVYPSAKSAFFYGIGASKRKQTSDIDSPNMGSSLASPSYSNVQVSDDIVAVGPSIGWDWIWPNGVTLLMDLGPRWDVSKSRKISNPDGESAAKLDVEARDKLLKKIDNDSGVSLIQPKLILGYSF